MHIFIDESGNFSGTEEKRSISAVGALIIPDSKLGRFYQLYEPLRRRLPKEDGEVKGRLLSETQVRRIASILFRVGCVFEIVVMDSTFQSQAEVQHHKEQQAAGITVQLTDEHHPNLVKSVWDLRHVLEAMPLQLYLQSCAMVELIYQTLFNADIYFAFRSPEELSAYNWIIDGKDKDKITNWEKWWSDFILPMIETKTFRKPMVKVRGLYTKVPFSYCISWDFRIF